MKAFEVANGRWVYLSDEDFEAAAQGQGSKTIDIHAFVPQELASRQYETRRIAVDVELKQSGYTSSDTQDLGVEREGEETLVVDLADLTAAQRAVEGGEAVHLAAIPNEDRFARLLAANVAATYSRCG